MLIPNELYNVKFAEYIEFIKIFYLEDSRFKEMCDVYCTSKTNTQFHKRKVEKHFRRIIAFENLSRELEEELLLYLIRNS